MSRVSRFIGNSYVQLFCELGLELINIEQIRLSNTKPDFQGYVILLLKAWKDTFTKTATIQQLLSAMKTHHLPFDDVVSCLTPSSTGRQKLAVL